MGLIRLNASKLSLGGLAFLLSACGGDSNPGTTAGETDTTNGAITDGASTDTEGTGADSGSDSEGSDSGTNNTSGDTTNNTTGTDSTNTPTDSDTGSDTTTDETGESCDAPKLICNGQCVNPNTNPNYCGASADCLPPNDGIACGAGQVCSKGMCASECATGELNCGGECIDPSTNKDHCGAQLDCMGPNEGAVCTGGQVCDAGECKLDCGANEIVCGGECINPKTSLKYCGAMGDCMGDINDGEMCPAGQLCSGGVCKDTCDPGMVKCDGTCVNPLEDNNYCGAMGDCIGDVNDGEICPVGSLCSNGKCEVQCETGLVECEGNCINPDTNNNFCGADEGCVDAIKCAAGQSCVDGECKSSCAAGQVKCNDECIDPKANNSFCGASGDCKPPNDGEICSGDEQCLSGICTVVCDAHEVMCGGTCINPKSDETYCGASDTCMGDKAGDTCAAGPEECIDGVCRPKCASGTLAWGDGCIDPDTDEDYCGATEPCDEVHNGVACSASERCIAGICKLYCEYPLVNCGGTCIDPRSSLTNCGAAGNCMGANAGQACSGGKICENRECVLDCAADQVACDDSCINPKTDNDYCGADASCKGGMSCGDGQVCTEGVCALDCAAGQINCFGKCIDPQTDSQFCGASGQCNMESNWGDTCSVLMDEQCVDGSCKLVCPSGEVACAGKCINPKTDPNYCGARLDCSGSNDGSVCIPPDEQCINGVCEDTGCGEDTSVARPEPVVIELVLDKSGSMVIYQWAGPAGGNETRWRSLHRAVMSLVDSYGPSDDGPGQAEFGALLFPNKKADLPFDKRPAGGTQYQCRLTSGSTNCGGTLDPWSAAIPHGSCYQSGVQRPPCTFDGCAVDDGRDANWRPSPDHDSSHFNGLIPPANARDIIGRTNSNLSYQYNPTYWSVESRRSEAMGGGTPTIAAMANAYSVLGLTQYIGRKKVVLLITDGATSCAPYNTGGGHATCTAARAAFLENNLYSVIRNARTNNDIKTYVIGVDLVANETLQDSSICSNVAHNISPATEAKSMAVAGGTTDAINVKNSDALNNAFNDILKDVISCSIDIGDKPPYPNDVDVFFPKTDGSGDKGPMINPFYDASSCATIPGGAAGWIYANAEKTEIELCNGACTDFKNRLTGEIIVVKGCQGEE